MISRQNIKMASLALMATGMLAWPALAQGGMHSRNASVQRAPVAERYDPYALWIGHGSVQDGSCYVSREQALIGGHLHWRTLYMCRSGDR
ncbi:MAG: hypothetical protein FJX29_14705 [Alphaproteobacteria bacterium]|nr:hypothetical protein [Alphaproteobacteria bacterium]